MKKAFLLLLALALFFAMSLASAEAVLAEADVNSVWERLTASAGMSDAGAVNLEEAEEPNAWVSFKLNKFSVHATTGLLETLKTKDELAGVLAHEIGHIQSGHYDRMLGRNLLWQLLFSTVKDRGDLARGAFGLGMALTEAGFSREQEIEADIYGIKLAAKAGYDPWGLHDSLLRMKESGYATTPSGFNSHPPTERRLARVRQETEAVVAKRKH